MLREAKTLLPTVNRWVEQAHAVVPKVMTAAPNMGPAQVSATLRVGGHCEFTLPKIESQSRTFLKVHWFTRNFIAKRFKFSGGGKAWHDIRSLKQSTAME